MRTRAKHSRAPRRPKAVPEVSSVFAVPSHGRLARRGSTEVVEETATGRRSLREPPGEAS